MGSKLFFYKNVESRNHMRAMHSLSQKEPIPEIQKMFPRLRIVSKEEAWEGAMQIEKKHYENLVEYVAAYPTENRGKKKDVTQKTRSQTTLFSFFSTFDCVGLGAQMTQ